MKNLVRLVDLYTELNISKESRKRLIIERDIQAQCINVNVAKKKTLSDFFCSSINAIDSSLLSAIKDIEDIDKAIALARRGIKAHQLIYEPSYKKISLSKERLLSECVCLYEAKNSIIGVKDEIDSSLDVVPLDSIWKRCDLNSFFNLTIPTTGFSSQGVLVNDRPLTMRFDCNYIGRNEDRILLECVEKFKKYDVFITSVNHKKKTCTFSFNKKVLQSYLAINKKYVFEGTKKTLDSGTVLVDIKFATGKLIKKDKAKCTSEFCILHNSFDFNKIILRSV